MILTDLLDTPVVDDVGRRLGVVCDARFVLDGPAEAGVLAAPRLVGLIVSPHSAESFAGYERTGQQGPALLARWFRWRMRGAFLLLWRDIARIDGDAITVPADVRRYRPELPGRTGPE